MRLNYVKSQSSVKPEFIDTTSSKKNIYLRRNIVETQLEECIMYEYEEAKLTREEYKHYLEELNSEETLESIEKLKVENKMLAEQIEMLINCILEMSELIYV